MEKIFKRVDGSRVKITAKLYVECIGEGTHSWSTTMLVCAPGKRTFFGVHDSGSSYYRSLSRLERKRFVREQMLKHATKDEIYEVMLAEWESIKPTIDQI